MSQTDLRERMRQVIFGTEPGAGRNFDIALIVVIIASIFALFLDSVSSLHERYGNLLYAAEIGFTILFSIEYVARVY